MTARDNCFFAIDQEVHAEWRRNNHGLELEAANVAVQHLAMRAALSFGGLSVSNSCGGPAQALRQQGHDDAV